MAGLALSDVVNVSIQMAPVAVPLQNFGTLCLAGPSNVIDVNERIREYSTLDEVIADFGTSAPEYLAADAYFSQSPRPNTLYIGRFAQTPSQAVLHGQIMTPTQQLQLRTRLSSITDGTMKITIDGTERTVAAASAKLTSGIFTASAQSSLLTSLKAENAAGFSLTINGSKVETGVLDFTSIATLDDAVDVINESAALHAVATCVWNSLSGTFEIITNAQGGTSTITYAEAPAAGVDISGMLQLSAGTGAVTLQGADGMNFSAITNLNGAASIISAALLGANCVWDGTRFNISSQSGGPTSTISYASAAGTGQDVSAILGLTAALASAPVDGIAAETPLACAANLRGHPEWYCLNFALTDDISESDYEAVATFIEGCTPISIFGYTTSDTGCLDATVTDDIMSTMQALTLQRTYGQFSTSNPYASASLFGRFATVDYQGSNTTITGKFKQLPIVIAETLTETQAATLKKKHGNVFVYYVGSVPIEQEAVMANGFFIDERIGMDWCANEVQTNLFNILYQSPKVPQTDAGVHILTTSVSASLAQGVTNGFIAPGQWNGPPMGQIKTGQQLPLGYYVYAPLVASQPQAIREQRISPTIQAAIKLAGAIHFADVIINVNR